MRRTIAHVGESDLSEGQWLEIALRKVEELAVLALPSVAKKVR